jgi:hypothetical protein
MTCTDRGHPGARPRPGPRRAHCGWARAQSQPGATGRISVRLGLGLRVTQTGPGSGSESEVAVSLVTRAVTVTVSATVTPVPAGPEQARAVSPGLRLSLPRPGQ